jgi:hypothetical protein
MIELTQLETQVLKSVIDSLYAEPGFSDVDAKDVARHTKLDIKSVRGALGSLVRKKIVDVETTSTYGAEQYSIIYLASDHYYLHPQWKNEREWSKDEMLIDLSKYEN